MSDMIERQAAIEALGDIHPLDYNAQAYKARIEKLPSAQPKHKQGKWIYGEHDVSMCDGYRCDKCGFFVPWDYQHKFIDFIDDYHFCPNCGADMRGYQNG